MKKFFIQYFSFSKREWQGISVLLLVILILKLTPYFFPEKLDVNWDNYELIIDTNFSDTANHHFKKEKESIKNHYQDFPFNPNTISKDSLKLLNLNRHQINTILFYQKNNWKFKNVQSFLKKVKIESQQKYSLHPLIPESPKKIFNYLNVKNKKIVEIELNGADSLTLLEVKGIGPKLSSRIVRYRDKLGGFYSINQLKEVYGINEEIFIDLKKYFYVDEKKIILFNLTLADIKLHSNHPYLSKILQRKINSFINQHGGKIRKIQLHSIIGIDSLEANRIFPYLID